MISLLYCHCVKQISPDSNQLRNFCPVTTGLEPRTAGIRSENSTTLPAVPAKGRFWPGALTLHPGLVWLFSIFRTAES